MGDGALFFFQEKRWVGLFFFFCVFFVVSLRCCGFFGGFGWVTFIVVMVNFKEFGGVSAEVLLIYFSERSRSQLLLALSV